MSYSEKGYQIKMLIIRVGSFIYAIEGYENYGSSFQ